VWRQLFNAPVTPVGAECKCTFCEGCFTNLVQFGGRCVKCKRGLPRDPSQWERNVEVSMCPRVLLYMCPQYTAIYVCPHLEACRGTPRSGSALLRYLCVLVYCYICVLNILLYMCVLTERLAAGPLAVGAQC
jgi:hypothetical protein